MSVTNAANALILASTIATSIDNIDVLNVTTILGELVRVTPQSIEIISSTERKYIFFLSENDANGNIVGLSLYGNGATITLGSGTEMASQVVNIPKNNSQGLLLHWRVRVI